jgi:dTDP-4-amino-4,6-dideoxygalactose transaminase
MEKKKEILFTGSDTEGGITSGYHMNDGINVKVPYSFFGSIYDEDEERMILSVLRQESQTMGPQVTMFQREFANAFEVKNAFATSNCTTAMHAATQAMGIKAGDEVIVTPITFIATSLVILKEEPNPYLPILIPGLQY